MNRFLLYIFAFNLIINSCEQGGTVILPKYEDNFDIIERVVNKTKIIDKEMPYTDYIEIDKIFVYGENLSIELENENLTGLAYLVIGENTFNLKSHTNSKINERIFLPDIEEGTHEIFISNIVNGKKNKYRLKYKDVIDIELYTVTRNGISKNIKIYTSEDRLIMEVNAVTALPDQICDVAVDAGHGGPDIGGDSDYIRHEALEALDISIYMVEKFEEHGIKACITRDHTGIPGHIKKDDSFADGGRIDIIFGSKAKYLFSNHLNNSPQGHVGTEVYSSVRTNNVLAQRFADAIVNAGSIYSTSDWMKYSNGTYKRYPTDYEVKMFRKDARRNGYVWFEYFDHSDAKNIDYYFIIRETGAIATDAYYDGRKPEYEDNEYKYDLVGLETYLLEYAYIDNKEDAYRFKENRFKYIDAVVMEFVNYINE